MASTEPVGPTMSRAAWADASPRRHIKHKLAGNEPQSAKQAGQKMSRNMREGTVIFRSRFGLAQVYFLFAVALPVYRGGGELVKAEDKPWDGAEGLEWTVPSPAPFHTFEHPPQVE